MASTTFVDGETLIEASWLNDVNAAVYTPGTTTAADITNVPAGNIAATNVQAALNELDTEKQPVDALLTALAAQTTAANNVQAYSGAATPTLLSTGTSSGNIPLVGTSSATDTLAGLVELATTAEAAAGTDTARAITPAGLFGGLNATGTAPIYACRAWVNFDGTGVVAINASGNVSSITDNGVGDYTVNFTTAMPDANYCVNATVRGDASIIGIAGIKNTTTPTASAVRISSVSGPSGSLNYADSAYVCVSIFR